MQSTESQAGRVTRCAFCAKILRPKTAGGATREHVVAKSLFPRLARHQLGNLIAPSCLACNASFKRDEEYARMLLATYAAHSAAGGFVWNDLERGAVRQRAAEFKDVQRGFRYVNAKTEAGIELGVKPTVAVDWPRIEAVVRKWVRGFFFKETGSILDAATPISVAMTEPKTILQAPSEGAEIGRGAWPGVFEYWWDRKATAPSSTRWWFLLWDTIGFVASTEVPLGAPVVDLYDGSICSSR